MKKIILVLTAICLITFAAGCSERIMDISGMENPNAEEDISKNIESQKEGIRKPGSKAEKKPDEGTADTESDRAFRLYEPLLNRFCELIASPDEDYGDEFAATGMIELARAIGSGSALNKIGYAVMDINNDGIYELLIGDITENEGGRPMGSFVFLAYTIADEQPVLLFEGWYRNSYDYIGEGSFLYCGAASAAQSGFGLFHLEPNDRSMCCDEFIFTDFKDDDFSEIGVYMNHTGEWDSSVSDELEATLDELFEMQAELEKRIQAIELVPLITIAPDSIKEPAHISVDWAHEVTGFNEVTVIGSEPYDHIKFTTDKTVALFTVLELSLENADSDGTMVFRSYPASKSVTLSPESPLFVGLTFAGDIPDYGIQYDDTDGTTRRFAIEISGEDGSLLLREADPQYYDFVLSAEK